MKRVIFVTFLVLIFLLVACLAALAGEKSYYPWELLSAQFGGAPHSVSFQANVSAQTPAAGGVLFLGGDDGGAYRSLDCGETWEHVNGGPGVSDGYNSGYPGGDCPLPGGGCHHGIVYGGPPSVTQSTYVPAMAFGPKPPAITQVSGAQFSYRVSGGTAYASDDAGLHWYPMHPTCLAYADNPNASFNAIAVDAGNPDHAVIAAGTSNEGELIPSSQDASWCGGNSCAMRPIAWTDGLGAHLSQSISLSQQGSPLAGIQTDLAAKVWRYATLSHLAVAADPSQPGACAAVLSQPQAGCLTSIQAVCHGAVGGTAPDPALGIHAENACLNQNLAECQCDDEPACLYPAVIGLTIDPRNGWTYASTQTGLLLSEDGGRSWSRAGQGAGPNFDSPPLLLPQGSAAGAPPYLQSHAAHLLTGIPTGEPDTPQNPDPAKVIDGGTAWDLNRAAWRIRRVGKMSMVFQAAECSSPNSGTNLEYPPQPRETARKRGNVRAYLPVTWLAKENGVDVLRSSVFMATSGPCDDQNADLVFRDVNTMKVDAFSGLAWTVAETDGSLSSPKLPRSEQYDQGKCYDPTTALDRCKMKVVSVAAAPSEPKIAYAWLVPDGTGGNPACPPGSPNSRSDCSWMRGIYQTVNGGNTWSLVAGATDPHRVSSLAHPVDIVVSAKNPYVAWYSQTYDGTALRLQPMPAAASLEQLNGMCSPPGTASNDCVVIHKSGALGNNGLFWYANGGCDKSHVYPNYCEAIHEAFAPAGWNGEGMCVQPPTQTNLCQNAGITAPVVTFPPQCLYFPPNSQPGGGPIAVQRSCVDCTTLGVAAGPQACAEAVTPPTNRAGEILRCCLGSVPLDSITPPSQMQCLGDGGKYAVPVSTATRGASEEWAYHATSWTLATVQGKPVDRYLIGADDVGADGSGPIDASTQGDGVYMTKAVWLNLSQQPDSVFQFALRNQVGAPQAFALANVRSDAASTLTLARWIAPATLESPFQAQNLGRVYAPTNPKQWNPWAIKPSRQFPAHRRLIIGPPVDGDRTEDWVFASVPGGGVFAVDTKVAKAGVLGGQVDGARMLSFDAPPFQVAEPGGVTNVPDLGPAVEDIAWDGQGWLWAVVGRCADPSVCSSTTQPGVYARCVSSTCSGSQPWWTTNDWVRVPQPWFGDPFSLAIAFNRIGTGDQAVVKTQINVGNWSTAGDCRGGLYQADVTGLDPRNLPADLAWKLVVRSDAISTVESAPLNDGGGSRFVYIGVDARGATNAGIKDVAGGIVRTLAGGPSSGKISALKAAPFRPGIYRVYTPCPAGVTCDPSAQPEGVVIANCPAGTQSGCTVSTAIQECDNFLTVNALQGANAGKLASCLAAAPTHCTQMDATAAADGSFGSVQTGAMGLVNAALSIYDLDLSRLHYDHMLASTSGGGAFREAPIRGNVAGHQATPDTRIEQGQAYNNTVSVGTSFQAATAWLVQFAEANFRYQFPHDGHDMAGTALANNVALPCPIGTPDRCLPSSGHAGGSRVQTFQLPVAARQVSPTVFSLAPSSGTATAVAASVVTSTATLLGSPALTVQQDGYHFQITGNAASAGRLKVRYTPATGVGVFQLRLNGSTAGPWTAQNPGSESFVIIAATSLRSGDNVLVPIDAARAPLTGLVVGGVDVASADMSPRVAHSPGAPTNASDHYLYASPYHARRSAAWLVVTLADASRLTMVALNGAPALLAQEFNWIEGPQPAPAPSTVRIPIDVGLIRDTGNVVHVTTAICATDCQYEANVVNVRIALDVDDDPTHCLPKPEICGDAVDQDCNGYTDDTAPGYCDGADLDGCRLGHQPCNGTTCQETGYPVPGLVTPTPQGLQLSVATMRFVYADASQLDVTPPPGSFDLLASLAYGMTVNPPNIASNGLVRVELLLHRLGGMTTWQGSPRNVDLRSLSDSRNDKVLLEFSTPVPVPPGSALVLRADPTAQPAVATRFFGCPDGTVTFPEHVPVVAQ